MLTSLNMTNNSTGVQGLSVCVQSPSASPPQLDGHIEVRVCRYMCGWIVDNEEDEERGGYRVGGV